MVRRTGSPHLLALSARALAASGCKGSSAGLSASDATSELVAAVCEAAFGCCNTAEVHWYFGAFVDETNCAEQILAEAEVEEHGIEVWVPGVDAGTYFPNLVALQQAIDEGDVRVNREALDECLELIRSAGCSTDEQATDECVPREPYDEENEWPCSPYRIFEGQVPAGESCNNSLLWGLDCQDDHVCASGGGLASIVKQRPTDGVCVALHGVGEPCEEDSCASGLYCSNLDGTCQPFRQLGEECQYSDEGDVPSHSTILVQCDDHLTCSPMTGTCVADCERGARCYYEEECPGDLVCVRRGSNHYGFCDDPRPEGAGCSDDADCGEGLGCDDTIAYDDEPGQCVPLTINGESCSAHSDCASGYCDNLTLCAAPSDPEGACASGLHEQCAGGYCEASVCYALKDDGDDCVENYECGSGECVNPVDSDPSGTCVSGKVALGEPCESDGQCESGACQTAADDPTCVELPLAAGEDCSSDDECDSFLCEGNVCTEGVGVGEECDTESCDPLVAFCDDEADQPVCADIRETGEPCSRDIECRSGDCDLRWGRYLCTAEAAPNRRICGGN